MYFEGRIVLRHDTVIKLLKWKGMSHHLKQNDRSPLSFKRTMQLMSITRSVGLHITVTFPYMDAS